MEWRGPGMLPGPLSSVLLVDCCESAARRLRRWAMNGPRVRPVIHDGSGSAEPTFHRRNTAPAAPVHGVAATLH